VTGDRYLLRGKKGKPIREWSILKEILREMGWDHIDWIDLA
jgi:hypothetical protein